MFDIIQRNPFATMMVCSVLLVILWAPLFFFPLAPEALDLHFMMPLQQWSLETLQLQGRTGIWTSFATISLATCILFAINRKHLFVAGQEQLMLLLFILISSATPPAQQFSGAQAASLCVLLSFYFLFNAIQVMKAVSSLFLSTFFASLASLFYLPSVIALLTLFVGILLSKPFQWRDWIAYLTGIATPYFYLFFYHYLRYGDFTAPADAIIRNIPLPAMFDFTLSASGTFLFIFLVMLALCAFLPFRSSGYLVKIKDTRMRQILRCQLLFLLIPALLFGVSLPGIMSLAAVPLSILAADYYDHIRRRRLFNLLLFLLCVAIAGVRIL